MSRLRDKGARHDVFFKKAREEGFAARAVYKLEDLDKKLGLLRAGDRVLDLGCRPGNTRRPFAGGSGCLRSCLKKRSTVLSGG